MNLPADPLLDLLVELRDLKQRLARLIALVNEAIIAQAEHALPRTGTVVPNTRTVALGYEHTTHSFAPREDATGIPDVDDPPSRDP